MDYPLKKCAGIAEKLQEELQESTNEMYPTINQEEYLNHDCHASPDDGCLTCQAWGEQQEKQKMILDTHMRAMGMIWKGIHG